MLSQHNAEDNANNKQHNWLICLLRFFKVKGLFKMTSRKEPLPLSIAQCNKIYILSPSCSQLWITKRGQNDDIKLKSFELQTIRKQPSSYYKHP